MPSFSLKHLAQIIERDSKDSTYKFALLRGTIDVIQNYPHYKQADDAGRIYFPMGLMVLKWIEYYYPLLASTAFIPQKYGDNENRSIAFRKEFQEVTRLYAFTPTSDQLMYDLKRGITDPARLEVILSLVRKLKNTIVKQPMHYIGSSVGMGGEIYSYTARHSTTPGVLTQEWIIQSMGSFSIPVDFHHVLQVVGAFVSGTNSIIFKWAEFTSALTSDEHITTGEMISLLNREVSERDVRQAKDFYSNILMQEKLECVWSGKSLENSMHIDHAFPFVALRNNDLWNLLPSHELVNIKKRDGIPAPELLKQARIRDRIVYSWEKLASSFHDQFFSEFRVSLLGSARIDESNWKSQCYDGLIHMSSYLIEERGLIPWKYNLSES